MANPYPEELRIRAVSAYESGEGSIVDVAALFGIGEATLKRWVWRHRATGGVEPQARGGGNPSPVDLERLQNLLAEESDATTWELTASYNVGLRGRARVHRSSILRALKRLGYVFKKNASARPSWTVPMFSRNTEHSSDG